MFLDSDHSLTFNEKYWLIDYDFLKCHMINLSTFFSNEYHIASQMVSHPDVMRTLLNSPFVQQMMSSPDLMRQLMSTNPQLCEVMDVSSSRSKTASKWL